MNPPRDLRKLQNRSPGLRAHFSCLFLHAPPPLIKTQLTASSPNSHCPPKSLCTRVPACFPGRQRAHAWVNFDCTHAMPRAPPFRSARIDTQPKPTNNPQACTTHYTMPPLNTRCSRNARLSKRKKRPFLGGGVLLSNRPPSLSPTPKCAMKKKEDSPQEVRPAQCNLVPSSTTYTPRLAHQKATPKHLQSTGYQACTQYQ